MQNLLVVEDDPMIRNLVKVYLEKEGYDVIEAEDGVKAKELFLIHHPCLVILDLMLPKLDGEAVCQWIREDSGNKDVPVLMLTAKSRSHDKIAGLKMGADHYMTKPFNPDELMAYVEALLRRTGANCQKVVSNGLTIMPRKRKVLLDNREIAITKHEFDLLYHLMSHPNIVFTREQLVQELYPHHEQDILDRTIDAHIKKLREKVEETPSKPARIMTKRGIGYMFYEAE